MTILFLKNDDETINEFKNLIDNNKIENEVEGESFSGEEWTQIIIATSAIMSTNIVRFLVQKMKCNKVIIEKDGITIHAKDADEAIKIFREIKDKEDMLEKN